MAPIDLKLAKLALSPTELKPTPLSIGGPSRS